MATDPGIVSSSGKRSRLMTGTMRAFVIKKVGETGVVEKPIPEPGPEEAIVRTTAALICTSDVHTVKGALPVPDGRRLATSPWASSTSSDQRSPVSRRVSASPCAR
jgi:hypothetical protein